MKRFFLVLLLVLLTACSITVDLPSADLPSATPQPSPTGKYSELTVVFIDVGQGDAAFLSCGGQTMLIDGGDKSASDLMYAFLKERGVSELDYVVATHAHADHVGGLSGALNFARAKVCYCPVTEYDTKAFRNFVKYLGDTPITVPEPLDTFWLGDAKCTVLAPIYPSENQNNLSIVLKIEHGGVSFLFVGDAEREEEQDILAAGYDLRSTVLKVGHHGSSTSTTYPFLREIMPKYAVISVGKPNTYNHPNENTLSRLYDADALVLRTDEAGTVTMRSDGFGVSVIKK